MKEYLNTRLINEFVTPGTDSRVGFGYRLGEHADFQVVFELGPQTNTKPIGILDTGSIVTWFTFIDFLFYFTGSAASDDSDTSKRNVDQNDYVMKNVSRLVEFIVCSNEES